MSAKGINTHDMLIINQPSKPIHSVDVLDNDYTYQHEQTYPFVTLTNEVNSSYKLTKQDQHNNLTTHI